MRGLLLFLLILLAGACAGGNTRNGELDEAQALLDDTPEKAFEKLNALDVSEFHDSATVARWALLYSEAMLRNRLTAPADTIIDIAVSYYRRHGDRHALQRALAVKQTRTETPATDELLQARYIQKVKEYALYKARREKTTLAGCLLLAAIAALGSILWMRGRLRLKQAEAAMLLAEADALRQEADTSRASAGSLFDKRFALIGRLCDTYYEAQGTRAERAVLAGRVKTEIEALRTDGEAFSELERQVNAGRDNLLTRLRKALPDIRPAEYTLAVYLACGFSSRSIALLLDEKIDNVYKRKSRLKARIRQLPGNTEVDFGQLF